MTSVEERIALVREGWQAFGSGDAAAAVAFLSPGIVVHSPANLVNSGTFHGHEGFMRWVSEWNEAWGSYEYGLESVEAIGERHALARVAQRATGRSSGVEVTMEVGWVYEMGEDGLCTYMAIHDSLEAARVDALERETG